MELRRALPLPRWAPPLLALVVVGAFLRGVWARWFLSDDAYISFRYAAHLADGQGLVFNLGERVEGYTNFLWVLVLAGGAALGAPLPVLAPVLGTLAGLGVLALSLSLGRAQRPPGDALPWLVPLTLAVHPSFQAWSSGGLETQAFSLLALAAVVAFLRERAPGPPGVPWRSALLLGLAALTRPEGVLFAGVLGGAFLFDVARGRRGVRALAGWAALVVLPVLAHLAWRLDYYGDWLPNTFRAKVPGPQPDLGGAYLAYFGSAHQLHLLLPAAVAVVLWRASVHGALLVGLVLVYGAYLLAVGGDFLEFRFLVPLLPYVYALLVEAVGALTGRARSAAQAWGWAAGLGALITLAAAAPRPWVAAPFGWERVESIGAFARGRAEQGRRLAGLVEAGVLPADLRVATGGLGALAFHNPGWYVLDHHGLTDRQVAALPPTWHRLGHQRNATVGMLRERGIEVTLLAQAMVLDDPAALRRALGLASGWLGTYNQRAHTPGERLRALCLQPAPGTWLLFGTQLPASALAHRFPRLTPCVVPGVPLPGVAGGLPGELALEGATAP